MILSSTRATASGAVDLPCFCSSAFTASAGLGWRRACSTVSVSIGFAPSDARVSSTAFICASGAGAAAATVASTALIPTAFMVRLRPSDRFT